jgi:hypothetical protein
MLPFDAIRVYRHAAGLSVAKGAGRGSTCCLVSTTTLMCSSAKALCLKYFSFDGQLKEKDRLGEKVLPQQS